MTRRGVLGLLGGGAALILGGCGELFSKHYRYKMTVEVDTSQGLKTDHATREAIVRKPPPLPALGESRTQFGVRGEAVMVEVAPGETLFALLVSDGGWVDYAAHLPLDAGLAKQGWLSKSVELWPNLPTDMTRQAGSRLPMLVRFRDINDPESVERVDPANLAESFGPGVSLKRISVELTSDSVTTRIEKKLGWLSGKVRFFDPDPEYGNFIPEEKLTVAHKISVRDFSSEFGK